MLIKFDAPEDYVEHLKEITGQKVASKAYVLAVSHYLMLRREVEALKTKNAKLLEIVAVQQQVIDDSRNAAKALLERVGQTDIFQ